MMLNLSSEKPSVAQNVSESVNWIVLKVQRAFLFATLYKSGYTQEIVALSYNILDNDELSPSKMPLAIKYVTVLQSSESK